MKVYGKILSFGSWKDNMFIHPEGTIALPDMLPISRDAELGKKPLVIGRATNLVRRDDGIYADIELFDTDFNVELLISAPMREEHGILIVEDCEVLSVSTVPTGMRLPHGKFA